MNKNSGGYGLKKKKRSLYFLPKKADHPAGPQAVKTTPFLSEVALS